VLWDLQPQNAGVVYWQHSFASRVGISIGSNCVQLFLYSHEADFMQRRCIKGRQCFNYVTCRKRHWLLVLKHINNVLHIWLISHLEFLFSRYFARWYFYWFQLCPTFPLFAWSWLHAETSNENISPLIWCHVPSWPFFFFFEAQMNQSFCMSFSLEFTYCIKGRQCFNYVTCRKRHWLLVLKHINNVLKLYKCATKQLYITGFLKYDTKFLFQLLTSSIPVVKAGIQNTVKIGTPDVISIRCEEHYLYVWEQKFGQPVY
jgi:hypothetical protein